MPASNTAPLALLLVCAAGCLDMRAGNPAYRPSPDGSARPPPDGNVCSLNCDAGRASTGLVGYWKLDEGKGTSCVDTSGTGNTGTVSGGVKWQSPGFPGAMFANPYALLFEGTEGLVDAGARPALANLRALTVAAWINPTTAGQFELGRIVDKRHIPGGWTLALEGPRLFFRATFSAQDGYWRTDPDTIVFGRWQHVAVTYNARQLASEPTFYMDGVPAPGPAVTLPAGSPVDDSALPLYIGNANVEIMGVPTPASRSFDGLIDDVRVYNRVLSPSEIADLHAGRP